MHSKYGFAGLVGFAMLTAAFGVAQPPAAPATTPNAAAEPYAQFKAARAEVEAAYRQIEKLRGDYQSATPAERQQINDQLQGIVAETQTKVDAMTSAAIEAYQADPATDPELGALLAAIAQHQAIGHRAIDPTTGKPAANDNMLGGAYEGGDNYEQALPILQTLIDSGYDNPKLTAWAGVCAVCVNDFDLAEKYLTQASESGQLDGLPPFPAPDLDSEVSVRMMARDYFKKLAEMRSNWEAEKQIRAAEAAADDLPRVKFTTTKGEIVIELFENQAPIATANIITLVKKGYYDGIVFHRVMPRFMAQGGDPTGTGGGGPGYTITSEAKAAKARKHFRGSLSMANTGRPNSGGSQFFLTFVPTDFLNGRHTVFGRVVEGIDVLAKLQRINPAPDVQGPFPTPDKIVKAEVLRDREHAYKFDQLPGS